MALFEGNTGDQHVGLTNANRVLSQGYQKHLPLDDFDGINVKCILEIWPRPAAQNALCLLFYE